jgi:hypothetical protein
LRDRDHILRAAVFTGAAALTITELLSPFHLLEVWPLGLAWLLAVAAWVRFRRRDPPPIEIGRFLLFLRK